MAPPMGMARSRAMRPEEQPVPVMPTPPPAEARQSVAQVEFRLADKVTAASGESLLLPFLDRPMPAQRVALFRADEGGVNPLVALLLTNDGTGALLTTGGQVRQLLLDGFTRTVRWPVALAALRDAGVDQLCIAGPDALFGRVRAASRAFHIVPADPRRALRPATRASA